jgi:hypothetical protein
MTREFGEVVDGGCGPADETLTLARMGVAKPRYDAHVPGEGGRLAEPGVVYRPTHGGLTRLAGTIKWVRLEASMKEPS